MLRKNRQLKESGDIPIANEGIPLSNKVDMLMLEISALKVNIFELEEKISAIPDHRSYLAEVSRNLDRLDTPLASDNFRRYVQSSLNSLRDDNQRLLRNIYDPTSAGHITKQFWWQKLFKTA
jgi:hypothetical protein